MKLPFTNHTIPDHPLASLLLYLLFIFGMTHAIGLTARTIFVGPEYYALETLKINTNAQQLEARRASEWQKFNATMQAEKAQKEAEEARQRYAAEQMVIREDKERAAMLQKHKEAVEVYKAVVDNGYGLDMSTLDKFLNEH